MARLLGFLSAALAILSVPAMVLAQAGRAAPAIELPAALEEGDFSEVATIDDTLDLGTEWTYKPDVPATPAKPLARSVSINLPSQSRGMALATGPVAIAGVLQDMRVTDGQRFTKQEWLLHRYKLTTGQGASPIVLYARTYENNANFNPQNDPERPLIRDGSLLSIGPDGKVAVVATNENGRIDVWSLAGRAKHIAGWKPLAQEGPGGQTLLWAAALSEEIVFTLNHEGRLVRWKLPECKALYERRLGQMTSLASWPGLGIHVKPGLSVNHQHLAVWSGKTLLIIELISGKTLAVLGGAHEPGWLQPTFHSDGTKLACTEAENYTQMLVTYDLTTGAELSRLPLPTDVWPKPVSSDPRQGGFTWVGEPYGVVGSTLLVNLAEGRPVWKFDVPQWDHGLPPVVTSGPDFWALINSERGQSLASFKLPHAAALEFAKDAPDVFAAGPGSTISVKTNVSGPADAKAALEKAVRARVEELGMKVGENQRVTLVVETEMRQADEEALVETVLRGFRRGPTEKVKVHAIIVRASYLVDGQVAWSQSRDYLPRGETWEDDPAKTTEQELIDIQWKRITTNAKARLLERVPGYVIDPAAQAKFPSGPYPGAQAAAGGQQPGRAVRPKR